MKCEGWGKGYREAVGITVKRMNGDEQAELMWIVCNKHRDHLHSLALFVYRISKLTSTFQETFNITIITSEE